MYSSKTYDLSDKRSTGMLIAKVFGVMFLGLLITGAIALGGGYFFNLALTNDTSGNAANVFLATLVISAIGILILSIVLPITFARGKHSILIPSLIYVILMGLMLSSITTFLGEESWSIFGITFLITSLIFGLMSLLALTCKGSLSGLWMVIMGLGIGVGSLYLINIFLQLDSLYLIIILAVFALIMFVTMYDIYTIKRIAQRGMMSENNIVLYCAFIIYTDFINIFIRILRFVIALKNR